MAIVIASIPPSITSRPISSHSDSRRLIQSEFQVSSRSLMVARSWSLVGSIRLSFLFPVQSVPILWRTQPPTTVNGVI